MRRTAEMIKAHAARCIYSVTYSVTLAVGLCVPAATTAFAESETGKLGSPVSTGPDMTSEVVDAALVRPLGVLSTVAGVGFFVVSLPLTFAAKQVETAREVLVETPYENTFKRPLGRI